MIWLTYTTTFQILNRNDYKIENINRNDNKKKNINKWIIKKIKNENKFFINNLSVINEII